MKKIEIPLNKKLIKWLLPTAIACVALGILFMINPSWFTFQRMKNPQIIRIAGIISVVFFGIVSLYGIYKMLGKKVGLIIDENGIMDNTSSSGVSFIHWEDIITVKREQLASTKFLLIYISNPQYYLERGKRGKKNIMKWNYSVYGTPLCISSDLLSCNVNKLELILKEKIKNEQENHRMQEDHFKTLTRSYDQVIRSDVG